MAEKILSVFVDESGNFGDLSDSARYCIITMVLHDQSVDISRHIQELNRANEDLGLDPEVFVFHCAPLIRQEGVFGAMSRRMRGRIFDRMLTFVRHVDFKYCSFAVEGRFVDDTEKLEKRLKDQIVAFIQTHHDDFNGHGSLRLYYDFGQKAVTRILDAAFKEAMPSPIERKETVTHRDYKLFQVADFICTMKLLELKLADGQGLNIAETRFFGGARGLKRNVLQKFAGKEIR